MDPDLVLTGRAPRRVDVGGLAPGDTIAQGASTTILIKTVELEQLRLRALVSGTTADLDLVPKLADGETNAGSSVPNTENLTADTEATLDVDVVGENLWELTISNTGAGPDVTIGFIDLYPVRRVRQ